MQIPKSFSLWIEFVRPCHFKAIVSAYLVSKKTASTCPALSKAKVKKQLVKVCKGTLGKDGKQLYIRHVSRKRAWQMITVYESSYPDDEPNARCIVSCMSDQCTATLTRLPERVRLTFYRSRRFLWEHDILLECRNVPNTVLKLGLGTITHTAVYRGVHEFTSHWEHIAHEKFLKRKHMISEYSNHFIFVISYKKSSRNKMLDRKISNLTYVESFGCNMAIFPQDEIKLAF